MAPISLNATSPLGAAKAASMCSLSSPFQSWPLKEGSTKDCAECEEEGDRTMRWKRWTGRRIGFL